MAKRRASQRERIRRQARDAFGYDALLPGQQEAIFGALAGRDALVVMPTGAGKSAIFQIAGLLIDLLVERVVREDEKSGRLLDRLSDFGRPGIVDTAAGQHADDVATQLREAGYAAEA